MSFRKHCRGHQGRCPHCGEVLAAARRRRKLHDYRQLPLPWIDPNIPSDDELRAAEETLEQCLEELLNELQHDAPVPRSSWEWLWRWIR